jgi:hypothetical protein
MNAMGQVVITLGGVTFQDFEVPQRISVEGGQRLAVHPLIGGGQVVDMLGDDPGKISFSGIFSGADAASRAQILDAATAAGAQLPLFWDSFFYTVMIEEFSVAYEKPWWIPFSLRCMVAVDPVAVIAAAVASVGGLVADDVASAVGLSGQAGVALSLGGGATGAALASAQNLVSAGLTVANGALSASAASLTGAATAASGITGLTEVVASAGQLAALSSMSGYVNRAAMNAAVAAL